MKVQIKKNLIIFENPLDWERINEQLIEQYGHSILISWKCKRELGFTVRHHQGLHPYDGDGEYANLSGRYYYSPEIHLDFYDDAKQSFFVLKYLNI